MKKLWLLGLILTVALSALAQEEGDEFFEDEPADPDYEYQPPPPPDDEPPPVMEPDSPRGGSSRGNRFSRPSIPAVPSNIRNNSGPSFGGGSSGGGDKIEFKLVDPPAYKEKKTKLNIPPNIRQKVEAKVKEVEKTGD